MDGTSESTKSGDGAIPRFWPYLAASLVGLALLASYFLLESYPLLICTALFNVGLVAVAVYDARRRGRKGVAAFLAVWIFAAVGFLLNALINRNKVRKQVRRAYLAGATGALIAALPVVTILILLLKAGGLEGKAYKVPSDSMAPTIKFGDRVYSVSYSDGESPKRGDIVAFNAPLGAQSGVGGCGVNLQIGEVCRKPTASIASDFFIKRIVALPNERLAVRDGQAVVDGKVVEEGNIASCSDELCNYPKPIKVPAGHYFVMGDNRANSSDSRQWGPVPREAIKYKVRLIYWPLSRFHYL